MAMRAREDEVGIGASLDIGTEQCLYAIVGMNATVLDKADIGEGAIIAAGAVVTHGTKVPAHEIWAGIPARKVKTCRCHPFLSLRPAADRKMISSNPVGWVRDEENRICRMKVKT